MSFGNCTNLKYGAFCPTANKNDKEAATQHELQIPEQENFEPWENPDQFGDQLAFQSVDHSIDKMISDTVRAHLIHDRESARRSARLMLRQVQKDKDHPRRALYLMIAKTIHAHCFDRSDRTKVLLAKLKKQKISEQTADEIAMLDALTMLCQVSF